MVEPHGDVLFMGRLRNHLTCPPTEPVTGMVSLADVVGARAKTVIEKELGFKIPGEQERRLGELLSPYFGENQFGNIVKFMAGHTPEELPAEKRTGLTGMCWRFFCCFNKRETLNSLLLL